MSLPEQGQILNALAAAWKEPGADRDLLSRRLFELTYPILDRLFASRGLAASDREDLIQEVYLRVFKTLERCPPDTFVPWLIEIAENTRRKRRTWSSRLKRRGREVAVDELTPGESLGLAAAGPGSDPARDLLETERRDLVRKEIAGLPPQMRRCAALAFEQGRSIQEIATLLQIAPGTVKAHLHAARKALEPRLVDRIGKADL